LPETRHRGGLFLLEKQVRRDTAERHEDEKKLLFAFIAISLVLICLLTILVIAENNQHYCSVKIDSSSKTQEEIADIVFRQYPQSFKGRELAIEERIFDYRIEKITIINNTSTNLVFFLNYYVGREIKMDSKEHTLQWTDMITKFVKISNNGDKYKIISIED